VTITTVASFVAVPNVNFPILSNATTAIPLNELGEPFYTGSVQKLYAVKSDDSVMVTQTTNRGSVFDVGALFEIPGSDVARAVFRHVLYTEMGNAELWKQVLDAIRESPELDDAYRNDLLTGAMEDVCERGARTHHEGMIDGENGEVCRKGIPESPSAYNVVRKYQILKPDPAVFLGAHLYDYSKFPHEDGFVIPLEYIVRFGITSGSSVYRKYLKMDEGSRKSFEQELGVSQALKAWKMLERPVSDCTSKFEPEDRMVSKQEALVMSGLTGDMWVKSGKMAVLGAWFVRHLLEKVGLCLWDIKWEFAKDGEDVVFVDTIDTDSFRATGFVDHGGERFVMNYNKQSMRDYFQIAHSDWTDAINDAKSRAAKEGVAFTELLKAGQEEGSYAATPDVAAEFMSVQVTKMDLIKDHMLGSREPDEVKAGLLAAGEDEIKFYEGIGKLDGFRQLNGV
jgi:phosphoribosylaminoimidazole-succinocarboxamide synthase